VVRDLGQQRERVRPQVEHLLSFLVELGALTVHGGELGGPVLGQRRGRLALVSSSMKGLEASRDDAQMVLVEKQCPGEEGRPGLHRVRQPFEHHLGRGADEDREP
jgi:hypothetical protein